MTFSRSSGVTLCSTLLLLQWLAPALASANDIHIYSGFECREVITTPGTALKGSWNAVVYAAGLAPYPYNTGAALDVICPIVRDYTGKTTGLAKASITIAQPASEYISCTLFAVDEVGKVLKTYDMPRSPTQQGHTFDFPIGTPAAGNSTAASSYYIKCHAGNQTGVMSYSIEEISIN